MESIARYGGWVVAVIAVAACLFMTFSSDDSPGVTLDTDVVTDGSGGGPETAAEEDELAEVKAEATALRAEVTKLQAELAERDSKLEELSEETSEPVTEEAATEEDEPSKTEDSEEKKAGPSRGERIANAQLAMMADMTYGKLYDDLGIPADVRGQLNDVIGTHMVETQKVAKDALQSKDQKAKDVYARMEAMKADLRAKLAETLTDEGLAAWDDYDPVADQMLYERLVDGQLNMMAPGLTEENRVLASQVMAEELVREFDVFNASDELYTLDNYNNAQARALTASLDRLNTALPQDQYDSVNGFVNHAITMFNAMSEQQSAPGQ